MSNITVSVLVPCYNCEKTIARTIDSIINQTYDNNLISLILCNDGSTDNTLKILKQYQNKYGNKKIIILDKKNEGSSIARKYLLDKCDSKYFMLMDSDDYYVPNAIKQLVNRLDRDVDVVVAKTIILNKHNHQKKIFWANFFNKRTTYIKYLKKCEYGYPWNKLIRTSILKNNDIIFTKTSSLDDLLLNSQLFSLTNNVAFCNEYTYYYDRSSSNLSGSNKKFISDKKNNDIIENLKATFEYIVDKKKFKMTDSHINTILNNAIFTSLVNLYASLIHFPRKYKVKIEKKTKQFYFHKVNKIVKQYGFKYHHPKCWWRFSASFFFRFKNILK